MAKQFKSYRDFNSIFRDNDQVFLGGIKWDQKAESDHYKAWVGGIKSQQKELTVEVGNMILAANQRSQDIVNGITQSITTGDGDGDTPDKALTDLANALGADYLEQADKIDGNREEIKKLTKELNSTLQQMRHSAIQGIDIGWQGVRQYWGMICYGMAASYRAACIGLDNLGKGVENLAGYCMSKLSLEVTKLSVLYKTHFVHSNHASAEKKLTHDYNNAIAKATLLGNSTEDLTTNYNTQKGKLDKQTLNALKDLKLEKSQARKAHHDNWAPIVEFVSNPEKLQEYREFDDKVSQQFSKVSSAVINVQKLARGLLGRRAARDLQEGKAMGEAMGNVFSEPQTSTVEDTIMKDTDLVDTGRDLDSSMEARTGTPNV